VKNDDDEIDRLLAFGRTSAPEQERMLERLARRSPKRAIRAGWAVAACAVLAWAAARFFSAAPSDFVARGGIGAPPVIEVTCSPRCAAGARLLFSVSYLRQPASFAAYAVAANGERVWFFPEDDGSLPELAASIDKQVVPRAIVLTARDEGRLSVRALVLSTPATRALISAGVPRDQVLAEHTTEIEVKP